MHNAFDLAVFEAINQQLTNVFLDWLMPWVCEKWLWIPLYLVLAGIVVKRHGMRGLFTFVAAFGLCLLLSDALLANGLKHLVQRLRPCHSTHVQVRLLVHCGNGFSFVSAHAANHAGLAVLFASVFASSRAGWVWWLGWAATIAYARVYVGVHWPTDVLCGTVAGLACGWLVVMAVKKIDKQGASIFAGKKTWT